jgi:hypothetical protein
MENTYKAVFLLFFIAIIAALPRFHSLGKMGFYGDEETTSFASRSLALTGQPSMPSGMPYHRGLPHSYANAFFVKVLGGEKEVSYRVFSAIMGTLAVALVFLLARPHTGTGIAVVAALMLALSEWHISVSRLARMYSPYMTFFILTIFLSLQCYKQRRIAGWVYTALAITACISFHPLGIFACPVILIPFLVYREKRNTLWPAIAFMAAIVIFIFGASNYIENTPYKAWQEQNAVGEQLIVHTTPLEALPAFVQELNPVMLIPALLGAVLGLLLARRNVDRDANLLHVVVSYGTLMSAGVLAGWGQIYGTLILLLVYFCMHGSAFRFADNNRLQIGATAVLLAVGCALVISLKGFTAILAYPFPYFGLFLAVFPGFTLVCIGTMSYLAIKPVTEDDKFLRCIALTAMVPILALGFVKDWLPLRYLVGIYPLLILLAAAGIVTAVQYAGSQLAFLRAPLAQTGLALLIVASGMISGHGVIRAWSYANLDYADRIPGTNWPHPDHKTAGLFVKQHLKPGDLVVAEDVLQQRWYAEQTDFWFRNPENHLKYTFPDKDSVYREFYTHSVIVSDRVLSELQEKDKRIWLITSAETISQRHLYLNKKQIEWLNEIEAKYRPQYVGRDNLTKVYLLNEGEALSSL